MNRTLRKLMIPGVGVVLATSGFAFMASNSVADSHAGTGTGAIAGYNVRNVSYHTVDNPLVVGGTYIQQVSFTVAPDNAKQVEAWFTDGSGQFESGFYADCSESAGTWTCQNPNVINGKQWAAVQPTYQLNVSANQ